MANNIKASLPLRHTLQIYCKKNDRNCSNLCQPQNKVEKTRNKEKIKEKIESSLSDKSKEKMSGNTDKCQIEKMKS